MANRGGKERGGGREGRKEGVEVGGFERNPCAQGEEREASDAESNRSKVGRDQRAQRERSTSNSDDRAQPKNRAWKVFSFSTLFSSLQKPIPPRLSFPPSLSPSSRLDRVLSPFLPSLSPPPSPLLSRWIPPTLTPTLPPIDVPLPRSPSLGVVLSSSPRKPSNPNLSSSSSPPTLSQPTQPSQ